jgi:hypothetical protein
VKVEEVSPSRSSGRGGAGDITRNASGGISRSGGGGGGGGGGGVGIDGSNGSSRREDKVTRVIDNDSSRKVVKGGKKGVISHTHADDDYTDVISIVMSQASIPLEEFSQLSVGPFEATTNTDTAAVAVTSIEPQIG